MKKPIINSNHYLALGVSCAIFIGSVLAFGFVYYEVGMQMSNTDVDYAQMNQDRFQQNQAHQLVDTLASTQVQRSQLQSFFVADDQLVQFITEVEGIGSQSGKATVKIASISADDLSSSPVGTHGSIHTHIDIQGSWADVMRAFHLVESLPYGESIDNVRAVPLSAKLWNIEFDMSVALIHQ